MSRKRKNLGDSLGFRWGEPFPDASRISGERGFSWTNLHQKMVAAVSGPVTAPAWSIKR